MHGSTWCLATGGGGGGGGVDLFDVSTGDVTKSFGEVNWCCDLWLVQLSGICVFVRHYHEQLRSFVRHL